MSTSDRDDMTTVVMACEEFMASTGIAPERLRELMALGWLESRTEGSVQFFRDAGVVDPVALHPAFCRHGFVHGKRRQKNRPYSVQGSGVGHVDQILKCFFWGGVLIDGIVGSGQDEDAVWMMGNNVALEPC